MPGYYAIIGYQQFYSPHADDMKEDEKQKVSRTPAMPSYVFEFVQVTTPNHPSIRPLRPVTNAPKTIAPSAANRTMFVA